MLDLTVLVVLRDVREALDELLPELCRQLSELALKAEIICLDTALRPAPRLAVEELLQLDSRIRLLSIEPAWGPSVALSAGIEAASGQIIAAIEGTGRYPASELTRLLPRLARADAVFGCRRRGWPLRFGRSALALVRKIFYGVDIRDPACLLWVARREAVAEIRLAPGQRRRLAGLIARQGFRVGEFHVEHNRQASSLPRDHRPRSSWFKRRVPAHKVFEVQRPSEPRAAA